MLNRGLWAICHVQSFCFIRTLFMNRNFEKIAKYLMICKFTWYSFAWIILPSIHIVSIHIVMWFYDSTEIVYCWSPNWVVCIYKNLIYWYIDCIYWYIHIYLTRLGLYNRCRYPDLIWLQTLLFAKILVILNDYIENDYIVDPRQFYIHWRHIRKN